MCFFFWKLGHWTHFVWMQFTVWPCFSVAVWRDLWLQFWPMHVGSGIYLYIDVPTELHSLLWWLQLDWETGKSNRNKTKNGFPFFFFFFFTESPKYSLMRIDLVSACLFFLNRLNILGFLNCGWVRKFRDSRILTFIQAQEYKHEQQSKNKNDQLLNVNGKFTYYFLATQCS